MRLYQFQSEAIATVGKRHILGWPTGTGKGFSALALYEKYTYPKPLLILAPASKSRSGDWERDIAIWFEGKAMPEYSVFSYEKYTRNPTVKEYKKNGNRGIWREWLNKSGFYVILDEVHKCKNPQSGTGRVVFEVLKNADGFVGLSATPMANGYIDAANYFKIFGFSKNITEFKKRYCNIQTYRGFPEIVGYYHESELNNLWNTISSKVDKDKVLDLPPFVKVPVEFPTSNLYTEVRKSHIFGDKILDNPSAYLHALRQANTEPKLPWLDDFLDGVSGHVVIFYNYQTERDDILKLIKKKHGKRTVYRQDGEKHQVPSKDAWENLPERTITLAQYQAGSVAVEMTYANEVIYFSPCYSFIDYEQSLGRTYRSGQKNRVTAYLLCCIGTIEREIWICLRDKKTFFEKVWLTTNEPNQWED